MSKRRASLITSKSRIDDHDDVDYETEIKI